MLLVADPRLTSPISLDHALVVEDVGPSIEVMRFQLECLMDQLREAEQRVVLARHDGKIFEAYCELQNEFKATQNKLIVSLRQRRRRVILCSVRYTPLWTTARRFWIRFRIPLSWWLGTATKRLRVRAGILMDRAKRLLEAFELAVEATCRQAVALIVESAQSLAGPSIDPAVPALVNAPRSAAGGSPGAFSLRI